MNTYLYISIFNNYEDTSHNNNRPIQIILKIHIVKHIQTNKKQPNYKHRLQVDKKFKIHFRFELSMNSQKKFHTCQ